MRELFTTPIRSWQQWGVIAIVALALVMTPQFDYNDWERNTDGLRDGLSIYDNPNSVYPPWGLILLWPYYLLTSPGSRLASGLVIGWLAARRGWSLLRFLAIIASPFLIWTMLLSNMDLLALLFPVLLWETAAGKRWQAAGWGAALAILLIKPQGGWLVILYLLWTQRHRPRELVVPLGIVALLTVPLSLAGSPPLIAQWIDNLRHPSAENREFWTINNVSLTDAVGPVLAVIAVGAALGGVYGLRRWWGWRWTQSHTVAALFLAAMLVAPYASNQGVIVPVALVASWPATLIQYAGVFLGTLAGVYRNYDPWWTLFFGLAALVLYRPGTRAEVTPPPAAVPPAYPPETP